MTLLHTALALTTHGCSVIPVRTDGTKAPAAFWKKYQQQPASEDQVTAWFTGTTYDGLGIITGAASGNLEMFELEGRAVTEGLLGQLATLLADHGLADLWQRIDQGYVELTPGGGFHWHYRVDGPAAPNTKLARRPSTPDELAAWKADEASKAQATLADDPDRLRDRLTRIEETTADQVPQVLIETRGEGGFTVAAPSAGRTHPTGAAWMVLRGAIDHIPLITIDERDALFAIANMLDQMPPVDIPAPKTPSGDKTNNSPRPGDDYNQRASWDDILTPHGWTRTKSFGGNCYGWTRPGKNTHDGISATTGRNDADNLYVFSSSTEFDTEKAYSKFAAFALLEHGGDYKAAAKALAALGYGTPPEPSHRVDITDLIADHPQPATDGNLAQVLALPAADQRPALTTVEERTLDRSDDGNALLLIKRFGDRIRFIPERGRWIAWDGRRWHWAPQGGGVVREYAKRVARSLPEGDQPANTHKKRSLSANGTTAMILQAETDERITTNYDELDAHPLELNTPGGAINLTTGHLSPPDPAKLHTRSTTVTPDPTMPTPRWEQFLDDTFAGHNEIGPFIRRLAGYSATGAVTHHVLPFLHGPGGNGKSVFLDVLRALLGDYAGSAPAKFLMAASQQHETEIARLAGLRMVICSEVNQNDKFDEAKVKLLTGGDALTARFMRQDHFTFTPTHHLWLMGNHQPKVSGGGESFWRRLRIVSFSNTVPDEKKVDDLAATLIREEGPGILAWIVAGAIEAIHTGLQAPDSVMAATDTYASEEDVLARFVADRCHVGGGPHVRTATSDVRTAYTKWCSDEGEQPLPPQVMGRELRTRYDIDQVRSNGRRYYLGVTLLADENEPDPAEEWWQK